MTISNTCIVGLQDYWKGYEDGRKAANEERGETALASSLLQEESKKQGFFVDHATTSFQEELSNQKKPKKNFSLKLLEGEALQQSSFADNLTASSHGLYQRKTRRIGSKKISEVFQAISRTNNLHQAAQDLDVHHYTLTYYIKKLPFVNPASNLHLTDEEIRQMPADELRSIVEQAGYDYDEPFSKGQKKNPTVKTARVWQGNFRKKEGY